MKLSEQEVYVVFAALCAMVDDIHAPQDTLTDHQWTVAKDLYNRTTQAVNDKRLEAVKFLHGLPPNMPIASVLALAEQKGIALKETEVIAWQRTNETRQ